MRRLLVCWLFTAACGRIDFAAVPDANVGDGATDGRPSDTPDVLSSCAGFLICDDFEQPIGPEWTAFGNVTLDSSVAHRGVGSVRMHMDALNAGAAAISHLREKVTFSPVPPALWVRGWFRVGGLPAGTNALELITFAHEGGGPASAYVFLRSDDVDLYVQPQNGTVSAGMAAPLNSWFCIVFEVVFATTATGALRMTSDVLPSLELVDRITNDTTAIDALGVGPQFAATNVDVAQPPFDVWVDDLIVHSSPVSCAD